MCTLSMAHCFLFLLVWFLILCLYDLISCGCRCLFRPSCIFFYIFFYICKIIFITFLNFFRSYSFLCAVLWWPVQWAFVAFLVTWNKYHQSIINHLFVSDQWSISKNMEIIKRRNKSNKSNSTQYSQKTVYSKNTYTKSMRTYTSQKLYDDDDDDDVNKKWKRYKIDFRLARSQFIVHTSLFMITAELFTMNACHVSSILPV